ncbi:hypothetical protein LTR53_002280 [Teratosphaeriaceae sp. CCFEE 6253]|nr:hypothetical protein LTR53_002280 [Teratosphaeriaceae sp. CCFEE 6253]
MITLYDIPSKPPNKAWSPNTWKVRATLNLKRIPYLTEWVEYPHIGPLLSGKGVKPNEESVAPWPYTLPAVQFETGETMMDSVAIIKRLEEMYPSPSLHLESGYTSRVKSVLLELGAAIDGISLYGVPTTLLTDESAEYFLADRKARLGADVTSYLAQRGREKMLEAAAPHIREIGDMLQENPDGPYFSGIDISYIDLHVASWTKFWERLGVLEEMVRADPGPWMALHKACEPYFARGSE